MDQAERATIGSFLTGTLAVLSPAVRSLPPFVLEYAKRPQRHPAFSLRSAQNAPDRPRHSGLFSRLKGKGQATWCMEGCCLGLATIPGETLILGWEEKMPEDGRPFARMLLQIIARDLENFNCISALREEVEFSQEIVQSISPGFLVLAPDLTVTKANQEACSILETDRDRLVGSKLTDHIFSPLLVRDAFVTGKPIIDREVVIRLAHKDVRILKTAIPVFGKDGSVIAILDHFKKLEQAHKLATRIIGAKARFCFNDLVYASSAMRDTVELGKLAADNSLSVLITGESGTGKELLAHSIHAAGKRCKNPFVVIDCAALPRELVASELFGHVDGAFTGARKGGMPGKFELADGGTLFLDELGELPWEVQSQFLRVLQSREVRRLGGKDVIPVDIRIIAATNRDLSQDVRDGHFREDLYYRLNVLAIHMPALRSRPEDIHLLAEYFRRKYCLADNKPEVSFSDEALAALQANSWVGNVRELENTVARAVHTCGGVIEARHVVHSSPAPAREDVACGSASLREMEKNAILRTVSTCAGNISRSARALGISRSTLYKKIASWTR
ncbi:MAG: sigma 54-interacting transcriptional regulator [Desulfovibrio sp.]|jgi:transcriptional regulator with PAS, ATPase and Fis domain|nr:sigma 54-interacting transcriptional regulator [Desulfovibrio sp.]